MIRNRLRFYFKKIVLIIVLFVSMLNFHDIVVFSKIMTNGFNAQTK